MSVGIQVTKEVENKPTETPAKELPNKSNITRKEALTKEVKNKDELQNKVKTLLDSQSVVSNKLKNEIAQVREDV